MNLNLSLRRLGILIILTNVLGAASLHANSATTPVPREDHGWPQRHEAFLTLPPDQADDILFLGDSITDRWQSEEERGGRKVWEEMIRGLKVANLGIRGDRTQHLLWRIMNGEVASFRPRLVIMLIGTNNIGAETTGALKNTPEEIFEGVSTIVAEIRARLPASRILLFSIFPRDTPEDPRRRQVEQTNRLLCRLHDGQAVFVEDIGQRFLASDGTLSRTIMPDLLHPNEHGYRLWAEAIAARLPEFLGITPGRQ